CETESRLVHILDDYLAALRAGTPVDRDQLLARYPELAQDLAECLASLEFIRRAAATPCLVEPANALRDEALSGILGDFRIVGEIGRGGMGVVYEALQISLDRRVALKILPFAAALDERRLQRFKNEALAAAHLHHTNIVPVYAVGSERGVHFYAMQFIEGRTLAALIDELREDRRARSEHRGAKPGEPTTIETSGIHPSPPPPRH